MTGDSQSWHHDITGGKIAQSNIAERDTTMTQETQEAAVSKLDEIRSRLAEAEKAVSEAMTEAASKTAAALALPDTDPGKFAALGEIGTLVSRATSRRDAIKTELDVAVASDRWETSLEIRQPVQDVIHEMLIESTPEAPLVSVNGRIRITDEGINVDLIPVLAKLDLSSIETQIAEAVDIDAFREHGFVDVTITIEKLDTESPIMSLNPTPAGTTVKRERATSGGNPTGARSGNLEYSFGGAWLSSRQFLEAVRANDSLADEKGTKISAAHGTALTNVLDNKGQGMSNLAKTIADKLKVERREKPADE